MKKALETLNESGMKIGQEVYQAAQAEQAQQAEGEAADAGNEDEVIDAEVVDEEEDNK